MSQNKLYYGDNLEILKQMPDNFADLIYLDPPFNSNRNYNVLFDEKNGTKSVAQIHAFTDTWKWDINSERIYQELVTTTGKKIAETLQGMRTFLGSSDMMAYLIMMAPRLIEMRRVLKSTGSIYLHCDPTASHYLKILMDAVFGVKNFRNEIVWHYRRWTAEATRFQRMHDIIFWYAKSDSYFFNKMYQPYSNPDWIEDTVRGVVDGKLVRLKDENGDYVKRKKENQGVLLHDVWEDINFIAPTAKERLGYPTQKPEELLERIINTSCPKNGIVLDPFCGCGTTISVAQNLGCQWIGIDITHLAISLIRFRLQTAFENRAQYEVIGEPVCFEEAQKLAQENRYQFQWWALGLVGARPEEKKKGADQGIDGLLYFYDEKKPKAKKVIIQIKSGHVNSAHIRDLRGVIEREQAQIGAFITLEPPSKHMQIEASAAEFYHSPYEWFGKKQFPKIQIITIEELLAGKNIDYPHGTNITLK